MIRLNRYLRDIGITEDSWPFNDIEENNHNKECHQRYDRAYIEDKDGFMIAETYSLDMTLAMMIYSYLRYFKEHGMQYSYPAGLTPEKWDEIVDKMILGFEMYIKIEEAFPTIDDYPDYDSFKKAVKRYYRPIKRALRLFSKYFVNLSW